MAKTKTKEIDLGDFNTVRLKAKNGVVYELHQTEKGGLFVSSEQGSFEFSPANLNTPKTETAIGAAKKAYEIGEEIKGGIYDGNIYIGLSAKTGKPLVTTAADIGIYNHADAEQAVANLNQPDNGGWRLPSSHWDKDGDELNNNLFENRNKGKLSGTFNLTGEGPAGWYWGAERIDVISAACQQFSGGCRDLYYRVNRSSVRPVREFSPRS